MGFDLLKHELQTIQKGKFSTLIETVTLTFHSSFNYFSRNDPFFQKQPVIVILILTFAIQNNQ